MKTARTLLAGLTLSLMPVAATAQDFPNKPIRLIVPFPAGGPNDIIARVVGQRMSEIDQAAGSDRQSRRPGRRARHRCGRKGSPRRLHDRDRERELARHQPDDGKGALRRDEGFRARHAGDDGAGNAGRRQQRSRQRHEGADRARQGPAGETQFRLRRRRRPAASCRRTAQADGQDRHRARALPGRCARHQRPARPAGADGVPRFAGAAAAYQGRHPAPDCARRSETRAHLT